MKKILALVLAVAMLSTTAFAAGIIGKVPDSDSKDVTLTSTGASNVVAPGSTIRIYPDAFDAVADGGFDLTTTNTAWRLCSEYFTISAKKFSKGANLVKEVKFNDDKCSVDIVLKDDYALKVPAGENLVIDNLSIKAKKEYKQATASNAAYQDGDVKKNAVYQYNKDATPGVPTAFKVGHTVVPMDLDSSPEYKDGKITNFKAKNDVNYETATITAGEVYMEGRVYADDKCYVGVDNDVNVEVLKLDDTASMRFYNITTNGLPTANTLKITAEEKEFVYKIVDNKIVASGLKWNADDAAFVGKIRSSASYVVSDVELKAAPAAEGDKPATTNPDTGANDVVGIAAALAVVSLVAAGAVSMKK